MKEFPAIVCEHRLFIGVIHYLVPARAIVPYALFIRQKCVRACTRGINVEYRLKLTSFLFILEPVVVYSTILIVSCFWSIRSVVTGNGYKLNSPFPVIRPVNCFQYYLIDITLIIT